MTSPCGQGFLAVWCLQGSWSFTWELRALRIRAPERQAQAVNFAYLLSTSEVYKVPVTEVPVTASYKQVTSPLRLWGENTDTTS